MQGALRLPMKLGWAPGCTFSGISSRLGKSSRSGLCYLRPRDMANCFLSRVDQASSLTSEDGKFQAGGLTHRPYVRCALRTSCHIFRCAERTLLFLGNAFDGDGMCADP